jgi:hypothetical protein
MVKYKMVTGVSIGFDLLGEDAYELLPDGRGFLFKSVEVLELSIVPIPANADATIETVKSLVDRPPAALGQSRPPIRTRTGSGASGPAGRRDDVAPPPTTTRSRKGQDTMKTLKELRDALMTKQARLKELKSLLDDDAHDMTEDEDNEVGTLTAECRQLRREIMSKEIDAMEVRHAAPVGGNSADDAARTRSRSGGGGGGGAGGISFARNADPEDKFPGQSFVRMVIAKAMGRLVDESPIAIAEKRWGKTHPQLVGWIRAAVAGGGTGSGEWGAELAQADTRYSGDFVDFLYGMTVFDKLPLRVVPENVHVKGSDGGGTAYWVGESKAIPVTAFDFLDVELQSLKVAALCVVSNKLLRLSDPAAEQMIRDQLAQASAQRVDLTFLSTAAAVAGVSPAGILNGLSAMTSAGPDADGVRADIAQLYAPFIAAKNASDLWLVTNTSLAKALGLLVNPLGQIEFPGLRGQGGQLLGDPIITGDNVGAGDLILLKPSDIWKIGERGVEVSLSRDATIEQTDGPTAASDTPTGAATTTLVSMFQTDSTAFKIIRPISYQKRRTSAVAYVGDAAYAPPTS